MRVLDLFSGIGGFSLGLERAGMRTVAFCEVNPFCRDVLRERWRDVPVYDDVRELTASRLSADGISADLICGGFPCQDISNAGKRAGIDGARSGLWSEYFRLIRELRPRYVIVENVAALLGRGIGRVIGDLAAIGFDAEWHCIPASAFGAPHQRDRIWIIAAPHGDADRPRLALLQADKNQWPILSPTTIKRASWWTAEPDVVRVVHGLPGRVDRIKALGNAIVPQIAEAIGKAITQSEGSKSMSLVERAEAVNHQMTVSKPGLVPFKAEDVAQGKVEEHAITVAEIPPQGHAVVTRKPSVIRVVEDAIPILDTARFEHMQRIAATMAFCSLIPACLKGETERETAANCFLVVNQAVRWNMDPFAVAQCVSVIHGKICHEGKLIAAVIEQKLGIELEYEWSGEGLDMKIVVSGTFADGRVRTVEGSVRDWMTDGKGTPWVPKRFKMMLAYRGAREWCRLHKPSLILGVYSHDEMEDLVGAQTRVSRSVTPELEPPTPPMARPTPLETAIAEKAIDATSETANVRNVSSDPVIWDENGEHVDPQTGEIRTLSEVLPAATVEPARAPEPPTPPSPPAPPKSAAAPVPATDPSADPLGLDIPTNLKRARNEAPGSKAEQAAAFKKKLQEVEGWLSECRISADGATTTEALAIQQQRIVEAYKDQVNAADYARGNAIFAARATEILAAADVELPPTPHGPAPFNWTSWLNDLSGACSGAESIEQLEGVKNKVLLPERDGATKSGHWEAAKKIYRARLDALVALEELQR